MSTLGKYVILRDVPKTFLRAGEIFNVTSSEWFSVKTVNLGLTVLDQRYFDFMLALGYINKVLPDKRVSDEILTC
jgi:hypothetical protein